MFGRVLQMAAPVGRRATRVCLLRERGRKATKSAILDSTALLRLPRKRLQSIVMSVCQFSDF